MTKVKRWCCTTCGGQSVYSDAWVSMNDPDDVRTFDASHCDGCDGECNVEEREVEKDDA